MAEVPEYLIERSRDAYFAEKGKYRSDDPDGEAPAAPEPTADSEATAEASAPEPEPAPEPTPEVAVEAPAPAEVSQPAAAATGQELEVHVAAPPQPPEPPRVYAPPSEVSGAKRHGRGAKIPAWLIPVYLLVPFLAIALAVAFINLSEESEAGEASGPDGAAIYSQNCAACHGPNGEGGVGPALDRIPEVFPNIDDIDAWVANVAAESTGPYGEGGTGNNGEGARAGAMPAFEGVLSPEEIRAVVIHELVEYSGVPPSDIPGAETGGEQGDGTPGSGGSGTTEEGVEQAENTVGGGPGDVNPDANEIRNNP